MYFFQEFEVDNMELVQADTRQLVPSLRKRFDVVIMNPPFGTKHNKGTPWRPQIVAIVANFYTMLKFVWRKPDRYILKYLPLAFVH